MSQSNYYQLVLERSLLLEKLIDDEINCALKRVANYEMEDE